MNHWNYFNWPEIKREAALRLKNAQENNRPSRELSFEYWCAWCAHANAMSIDQRGIPTSIEMRGY